MRFLIDNALSPMVAAGLRGAGHDALHVRDLGMAAAPDTAIFAEGLKTDRIIVSADTDFGMLLARQKTAKPSVVLFRRGTDRRPGQQVALLLANLPGLAEPLDEGCVAVMEETRIRVRQLPIAGCD